VGEICLYIYIRLLKAIRGFGTMADKKKHSEFLRVGQPREVAFEKFVNLPIPRSRSREEKKKKKKKVTLAW